MRRQPAHHRPRRGFRAAIPPRIRFAAGIAPPQKLQRPDRAQQAAASPPRCATTSAWITPSCTKLLQTPAGIVCNARCLDCADTRMTPAESARNFLVEVESPGLRRQRVADAKTVVADQTPIHIPRPRFIHRLAFLAEKFVRTRQPHLLFRTRMMHRHVPLKFPRTNPHKRDAIPMPRIHVRLNFENEPRKIRVLRRHRHPRHHARLGRRRIFQRRVEQQVARRNYSLTPLPKNTGVVSPRPAPPPRRIRAPRRFQHLQFLHRFVPMPLVVQFPAAPPDHSTAPPPPAPGKAPPPSARKGASFSSAGHTRLEIQSPRRFANRPIHRERANAQHTFPTHPATQADFSSAGRICS